MATVICGGLVTADCRVFLFYLGSRFATEYLSHRASLYKLRMIGEKSYLDRSRWVQRVVLPSAAGSSQFRCARNR